MNQRQTQRLEAIVAAFVENMKSFAEDFSAVSDEKDTAIAKQLQRESDLLRENDKLRELVDKQTKLIHSLNEKIEALSEEKEGLKAENEELLKKAPKVKAFGKYTQADKKPAKKAVNGFRIEKE